MRFVLARRRSRLKLQIFEVRVGEKSKLPEVAEHGADVPELTVHRVRGPRLGGLLAGPALAARGLRVALLLHDLRAERRDLRPSEIVARSDAIPLRPAEHLVRGGAIPAQRRGTEVRVIFEESLDALRELRTRLAMRSRFELHLALRDRWRLLDGPVAACLGGAERHRVQAHLLLAPRVRIEDACAPRVVTMRRVGRDEHDSGVRTARSAGHRTAGTCAGTSIWHSADFHAIPAASPDRASFQRFHDVD